MNFFTKKNKTFLSLEMEDFSGDIGKFKDNLASIFPIDSKNEVTLNVKAVDDIPAIHLSYIISFTLEIQKSGAVIHAIAKPNAARAIKLLMLSSKFNSLTEEEE